MIGKFYNNTHFRNLNDNAPQASSTYIRRKHVVLKGRPGLTFVYRENQEKAAKEILYMATSTVLFQGRVRRRSDGIKVESLLLLHRL